MDIKAKLALLKQNVDKINEKYEKRTADKKETSNICEDPDLPRFIIHETPEGPVFYREFNYPSNHRHGRIFIREITGIPGEILGFIAQDEELAGFDVRKALFLDTETTGLVGGSGTLPFLVGVGFFNEDQFIIRQYFAPDYNYETCLLKHLNELMKAWPDLVTYNGKAYDMPLIYSRMIMNRLRPASPDPMHLDLLHPARRFWKNTVDSCSLSSLENSILGVFRQRDVPSALIPELYFQYLRHRNFDRLEVVFEHNLFDILSMAVLMVRMWTHLEYARTDMLKGCEFFNLGRIFERRGEMPTAISFYEKALRKGGNPAMCRDAMARLSKIQKKCGQWEDAVSMWETMATESEMDIKAHVELAKYYEHRVGDYEKAVYYVNKAFEIIKKKKIMGFMQSAYRDQEKLNHRMKRLKKKLG